MKVFGVVYKITNTLTGQVYIGQTTQSASSRFYAHCEDAERGSSTKLHNAMRKFGYQNFEIVVLYKAHTRDELNRQEISAIADYDAVLSGYNMTSGGSGEKPTVTSALPTDTVVSPAQVAAILRLAERVSAEDIARALYLRPSLIKTVLEASETPNTPLWRDILTSGLVNPEGEPEYEEEASAVEDSGLSGDDWIARDWKEEKIN